MDSLLGNDSETKNETTVIARQQLCKYATVLEPLLGCDPRVTMEVSFETMFSAWYMIWPSEFSSVSAVQSVELVSGAERVGEWVS
jgi:hypothetical protein